MSNDEKIDLVATVNFRVRQWAVPSFAASIDLDRTGIPVSELTLQSLDMLAQAWIDELYKKAGKPAPTFTRQR